MAKVEGLGKELADAREARDLLTLSLYMYIYIYIDIDMYIHTFVTNHRIISVNYFLQVLTGSLPENIQEN